MTDKLRKAIKQAAMMLIGHRHRAMAEVLTDLLAAEPDNSARWAAADKLAARLKIKANCPYDHEVLAAYDASKPKSEESPDDYVEVACSQCYRIVTIMRCSIGKLCCLDCATGTCRVNESVPDSLGVFEEV